MNVSKNKLALILSIVALFFSVTWGSILSLLGLVILGIISLGFSSLVLIRNRKSNERIDMKLVIAVFLSLVTIIFQIGSVVSMYEFWGLWIGK